MKRKTTNPVRGGVRVTHRSPAFSLTLLLLALWAGRPSAFALVGCSVFDAECSDEDPPGACLDALHSSPTAAASNDCEQCPEDGLPVWWVSEPHISLRISDRPLVYRPAIGPVVAFQLAYRQRVKNGWPAETRIFGFGRNWSCSFSDCIVLNQAWTCDWARLHGGVTNRGGGVIPGLRCDFVRTLGLGSGAQNRWEGGVDARDGSRLFLPPPIAPSPEYRGCKVLYADGSSDIYQQFYFPKGAPEGCAVWFLSERRDARGLGLTYEYSFDPEIGFRLKRIKDATGGVTRLEYNDGISPTLVTAVEDPSGRRATLAYDELGNLVNVTDTAGLQSSFRYDPWGGELQELSTPYGLTRFEFGDSGNLEDATRVNRYLRVIQPDEGQQLFLYRRACGLVSPLWGSPPDTQGLPDTLPPGGFDSHISAHWGARQYAALSPAVKDGDLEALTMAEYALARVRHWLDKPVTSQCSTTIGCERSPGGLVTWYDYAGKTNGPSRVGASALPRLVAFRLPTESVLSYRERNAQGSVTNLIETFTTSTGALGLRTNTFTYAPNLIDLIKHSGPKGETVSVNTYGVAPNGSGHYLLTTANAYQETTSISYNYPSGHPATITLPSGGVRMFGYGPDLRLAQVNDWPTKRREIFTYYTECPALGRVRAHRDARGLVTTYFWDGLGRLTGQTFSDGSGNVTNFYDRGLAYGGAPILDLTATKDRLGHWTYFAYDSMRRLTFVTNANQQVTALGYCDCGSLSAITNALGTAAEEITTHDYDLAGNRYRTVLPEGTTITRTFDPLGRVTSATVGDTTRYYFYNNQGLLTAVNGPHGSFGAVAYDIYDRPVSVRDAAGVTVTSGFDPLGRLSTRAWPDGAVETRGYTLNVAGPTYVSHPATGFTQFAYDAAGRVSTATDARNEILRYTYSAAGDLVSLTDGQNQTTRWTYDVRGRVTNKTNQTGAEVLRLAYDLGGRITSRWTPAKGITDYSYDNLGNLTGIDYPATDDVALTYNALNRLTTMADGLGTTAFAHAPGGMLAGEDGPWTSDTVTLGYANGLRTSLRLEQPGGDWPQTYGYDTERRLTSLSSPAGAFAYRYVDAASPLVRKLTLPNASTIDNTYDTSARLLSTTLRHSGGAVLNAHAYTYLTGGQRETQTRTDGNTVTYNYDGIGQLIKALGTGGQSPENLGYGYDAAWNLRQRTNGLTLQTFNVDGKNQMTSVPDGSCTYDANGNLVSAKNGLLTFAYDDENRLTLVLKHASPGRPNTRSEFAYDGFSRLRVRRESRWVTEDTGGLSAVKSGTKIQPLGRGEGGTGTWQLTSETRYVYDGRRVIQERNGNNVPLVSYTRGNDLSGSWEGAGGIGGLLGRSHGYNPGSGAWSAHNYYHADGAGNVTYLVNISQMPAANYRYDPYGNLLASSGTLSAANVYRFSSKELHLNSGLYAYGYRFYSPNWQRWLNQDPIGEAGGLNLYGYVGNNPINFVDPLGLSGWMDMRALPNYTGPSTLGNFPGPTMQDLEALGTLASIFLEPLDWAMMSMAIYDDPTNPWNYAGFVPFVPSAVGKAGKKICETAKKTHWANPKTLADHFARHGADFGAKSAEDYAGMASDFFKQSQAQRFPTKIASDGTIRVYDPKNNIFGSYNPSGTTKTFYKPDPAQHGLPSNLDYWNKQPGASPWEP